MFIHRNATGGIKMKAYEITYSQDCLVLHETITSESVASAIEEFEQQEKSFYVDILGIIESDLPLMLRSHAF
jgi:hypothetical protein